MLTFTLDRLQVKLDEARKQVSKANRRHVEAVRAARALRRVERSLLARAGKAKLLSRKLELERRAVQAGIRRRQQARPSSSGASSSTTPRQRSTRHAQEPHRPRSHRRPERSSEPRRTPAATSSLVGGGPSVVSVSELHHDYPRPTSRRRWGSALRPRRRRRRGRLAARLRELRHRLRSRHRGRPQLDVLPPLVPRTGRRAGRVARGGSAGRPRRLDGPLDRSAPAPPDRAGADLPAAGRVVPLLRRHCVRMAGIRGDPAASGRAALGRAGLRRGRPAGLRGRRRRRRHRVLPRLLSLARVLPTRE